MKHNVEFKGFASSEKLRDLVEELVSRLDSKVKGFSPDRVFLRVLVEQRPAHKLYKVAVTLDVPGKILAANQEGHELEPSIRRVFDEIERQLEDHKSTLRGEHLWKRLRKREELRQKKVLSQQLDFNSFFSFVSPHLELLNQFVGHELAYAEANGDLVEGEVTTEEVTDAALLRAYEEFSKDPVRGEIRSWLVKLARHQLEAEINRSRAARAVTVHIEEDIPETPPTEEVSTLGEEILDFYQPDEDLKVEDVVPDLEVPTPEQVVEAKELRECVNGALAAMPSVWRQLLMLRNVQGLSVRELARATNKTEAEIGPLLEEAQAHLRRRLIELGCSLRTTAST